MVKPSRKHSKTALLEAVLDWQGVRRGGLPIALFPLLLKLLDPRLQLLALLVQIVRIAGRAAIASARLGLRLERFPDHRRLGIVGHRENAEHLLARSTVDPHPADAGRSDEGRLRLLGEGSLGPLLE